MQGRKDLKKFFRLLWECPISSKNFQVSWNTELHKPKEISVTNLRDSKIELYADWHQGFELSAVHVQEIEQFKDDFGSKFRKFWLEVDFFIS